MVISDSRHTVLKYHRSKMSVICNYATICSPGYHYNDFVATHSLWQILKGGYSSVKLYEQIL